MLLLTRRTGQRRSAARAPREAWRGGDFPNGRSPFFCRKEPLRFAAPENKSAKLRGLGQSPKDYDANIPLLSGLALKICASDWEEVLKYHNVLSYNVYLTWGMIAFIFVYIIPI